MALTTNGALERHAQRLFQAGLDRVTVSMDALSPPVYSAMGDVEHGPEATLLGIEKALGGLRVKVNCVVRAGSTRANCCPSSSTLAHVGSLFVSSSSWTWARQTSGRWMRWSPA